MDNGNNAAGAVEDDQIVLTYNRVTEKFNVGGKFHSFELGLEMLSRAQRVIENKLRMEAALQAQAELAQRARDLQVAAELRKR